MRLLAEELKKIWNPVVLGILALLGVLYYFLFPSYYMKDFGYGGSGAFLRYPVYTEWAEKYGPTLEPAERAELDGQLEAEKIRFAAELAAFPSAAERGITDWDSFDAFAEARYGAFANGEADMEEERLFWLIVENTCYFRIDAVLTAMEHYDNLAKDLPPNLNYDGGEGPALTAKKLARIAEIKRSGQVHGYLPVIIDNALQYVLKSLAVWSVLSVVLLLSPTLVRDRLHRTRQLQWSSRRGRSVLRTQFLAAGLSALGLGCLNLAAYAIPFLRQGPLRFRDFPLFNFQVYRNPWFDWTFGTYLLVLALMILVLTLSAAGLAVVLSQHSGHYVAMLLKALPLFAALAFLWGGVILERPFFFGNPVSNLLVLPGGEFFAAALCAALSLLLRAAACRRQRRRELPTV